MMKKLREKLAQEEGSTTIEFVILFPVLMTMVFAMFESGWLMTRYMMLDRGVDMAIRDLKVGTLEPTHDNLKASICDYSAILTNCEEELLLELVLYDDIENDPAYVNYPHNQAYCFDRDADEPLSSQISTDYARDEEVFLRACMLIEPLLRGIGVGFWMPNDPSGAHQMVSFGLFKTEPS